MSRTIIRTSLSLLVALFALGGIAVIQAAPNAAAKASGQFNFYGSSSRNALSSARAQAGTFRQYAEGVSGGGGGMHASPIVAKESVDSIGQAVARSEAYLAAARRQVKGDAAANAALDAVVKELADVKKCCAELADCCDTDLPDAKRSAECCTELEAALSRAIAAHDRIASPTPKAGHSAPAAGGHHGGTP